MFPIILDIKRLKILLIGDGAAARRRLQLLQEAGCEPVHIKSPPPEEGGFFSGADIVFIADFNAAETKKIYAAAKEAGALVNAEDMKEYCDFHVPALVRRGDLLLSISTNAASPRLARRLRQKLEKIFSAEWAQRLDKIKSAREEWKKQGADIKALAAKSDEIIDGEGWLEELK